MMKGEAARYLSGCIVWPCLWHVVVSVSLLLWKPASATVWASWDSSGLVSEYLLCISKRPHLFYYFEILRHKVIHLWHFAMVLIHKVNILQTPISRNVNILRDPVIELGKLVSVHWRTVKIFLICWNILSLIWDSFSLSFPPLTKVSETGSQSFSSFPDTENQNASASQIFQSKGWWSL